MLNFKITRKANAISFLILFSVTLFLLAGCGGGSDGHLGKVDTLPPAVTAGKASLEGVIMAPKEIVAGRIEPKLSDSMR